MPPVFAQVELKSRYCLRLAYRVQDLAADLDAVLARVSPRPYTPRHTVATSASRIEIAQGHGRRSLAMGGGSLATHGLAQASGGSDQDATVQPELIAHYERELAAVETAAAASGGYASPSASPTSYPHSVSSGHAAERVATPPTLERKRQLARG
eukprot:SAG25_NODE_4408_length_823_cov_1.473757_1_plen_153_part_10